MTTKYADDPATEAAKKRYEEEKKGSDKTRAASAAQLKGKPTPTQEENDLTMLGAHILEHEADGSDPDPHGQANPGHETHETRHLEGGHRPAQSYSTRQQRSSSE